MVVCAIRGVWAGTERRKDCVSSRLAVLRMVGDIWEAREEEKELQAVLRMTSLR